MTSERQAYYANRRQQMLELRHLRPFWQLVLRGEGGESRYKTLLATDPFWSGKDAPWNCTSNECDCSVFSLSRIEMVQYVEAGCSPGDESAKDQLRIWEQGNDR